MPGKTPFSESTAFYHCLKLFLASYVTTTFEIDRGIFIFCKICSTFSTCVEEFKIFKV